MDKNIYILAMSDYDSSWSISVDEYVGEIEYESQLTDYVYDDLSKEDVQKLLNLSDEDLVKDLYDRWFISMQDQEYWYRTYHEVHGNSPEKAESIKDRADNIRSIIKHWYNE